MNQTSSRILKKALVTGGAGFVGSHLASGLLAKGIETVVLDDLSAGDRALVPPGARFVHGDVRDSDKVAEAMDGCDTIFHLAAWVDLQKSIANPKGCLSVNVDGTAAVIQETLNVPGRKIIFASSASVYPLNPKGPLKESDAVAGETPYALSKRSGEQALAMFAQLKGLASTSLRCFNIYGPGQKVDSAYAAVIPKFIALAKAGKKVPVNGTGAQTRDFIHVSDVVDCYILAAQSQINDIFNVGTGEATSIKRLAELICSFEGKSEISYRPAQSGDASASLANISHLQEKLGFRPKISLEAGLRALYES